jgi:hypothetical protein
MAHTLAILNTSKKIYNLHDNKGVEQMNFNIICQFPIFVTCQL